MPFLIKAMHFKSAKDESNKEEKGGATWLTNWLIKFSGCNFLSEWNA